MFLEYIFPYFNFSVTAGGYFRSHNLSHRINPAPSADGFSAACTKKKISLFGDQCHKLPEIRVVTDAKRAAGFLEHRIMMMVHLIPHIDIIMGELMKNHLLHNLLFVSSIQKL